MVIDTMIDNRLKHRVHVMFHLPNIFHVIITNGNIDQQKCHITPNNIYFRNIKYIARINISATRHYTFFLLQQAMFHFTWFFLFKDRCIHIDTLFVYSKTNYKQSQAFSFVIDL